MPPAFIVQSNIAFQAVFECSLYLDEHLVYLPLREISIDQYIAKKISEYERVKDNHLGFYNEDHWAFLSKYQNLLIHRNSTMGITIATQWIVLSDKSAIWKPIVERDPWAAERLRPIPMLLKERGESVTLEAVLAESKSSFLGLSRFVNQAIQHEYLKAYISEFCVRICAGLNCFFDLCREYNVWHEFVFNLNLLAARPINRSTKLFAFWQFIM